MRLAAPRRWIELYEVVFEVLVNLQDGGLVAAAVAVVWSGKDGHGVLVVAPGETLHCQLMGTGNQHQPVIVVELLGDVLAERVAGAARANPPPEAIIWIRPDKITPDRVR